MTRVGGPVSRLRDVARFVGGPLNGQRDPFDLLDRERPPAGSQRVEFEEGGDERCALYECAHAGSQGYVWRFLRELDAELGLGDGAYDRKTGEIVDVSVPLPPPPPRMPCVFVPVVPPPPPAPPPPPPPPPRVD